MTTTPLEHDYIGMEKMASTASSSSSCTVSASENTKNKNNVVNNLKETELRLGLPGSESPEANKAAFGLCLFGKNLEDTNKNGIFKSFAVGSGAKRGFFDVNNASEKWVFSGNGGSQGDLCNGGDINKNKNTQNSCLGLKESGLSQSPKAVQEKKKNQSSNGNDQPAAKAQVVGWPPIRSYRKNTMATTTPKNNDDGEGKLGSGFMYIKVSMDGAPYLRKVDLKTYSNYTELSSALEKMFSCFTIGQSGSHGHPRKDGPNESRAKDLHQGSEYVLTFEDKDGDWMLVGDVPWDMFTDSCRRLRIMKASDAIGLAPRAVEKSKNHS